MLLKPVFQPVMVFLEAASVAFLFLLVFGTTPIIVVMQPKYKQHDTDLLWTLSYAVLAITALLVLFYYVWKKYTYKNTQYQFFSDRVGYEEGFLNIQKKEVTYDRILEVQLSRNILQRFFNLGTIILRTAATTMDYAAVNAAGIKVRDIENSEQVYSQVRALLKK